MTAFRQPHFNYTKYETAPSSICELHPPPPLSFSLALCSPSQLTLINGATVNHSHTQTNTQNTVQTKISKRNKCQSKNILHCVSVCVCECVCARKHFDSANHAHCTFMQTLTSTATLTALLGHCNQCVALIAKFFKWFFAQPFCPPSPLDSHWLCCCSFLAAGSVKRYGARGVRVARAELDKFRNFIIKLLMGKPCWG